MYGLRLPLALGLSVITSLSLANTPLADLYRLANANSPELQINRNEELIGQENLRSALGRLLPSVNASASLSTGGEDLSLDFEQTGLSAGINLNQVIYDQRAISGYRAVEANSQISALQTQAFEQQLMLDVAEAAISVLRAQTGLQLAEREQRAIERQLEQTREKFAVGLVARTDVEQAQAVFDSNQVRLIQAQSQRNNAERSLATLVGEPATVAPLTRTQLDDLSQLTATNLQLAMLQSPNLQIRQQQVRSQDLQLDASKAQRLPSVGANLGYNQSVRNAFNDNDTTNTGTSSLSLSVSVPLFNGFQTTADIRQQQLRSENARLILDNQQRQLADQIAMMVDQLSTGQANIRAQEQLVRSRQSALEATQTGQEVGTQTLVDVLQAQSNFFAAEQDLVNARFDHLLAQLRLKQAAGLLNIGDLQQLN